MKKSRLTTLVYVFSVFLIGSPLLVMAASATLTSLLNSVGQLLNTLIPFIIGLGLVFFLFGIVKYMTAGGGEDKAAARNMMIYGVVALFVMVSVWGLVNFLQVALGINGTSQNYISAPSIPSDFYSGPGQPPINPSDSSFKGGTETIVGSPFNDGNGFTGQGPSYQDGTGVQSNPGPVNQY